MLGLWILLISLICLITVLCILYINDSIRNYVVNTIHFCLINRSLPEWKRMYFNRGNNAVEFAQYHLDTDIFVTPIPKGSRGWCMYDDNRIVVNSDNPQWLQQHTLCHEIAHMAISKSLYWKDASFWNQTTDELIVDTLAYYVCGHSMDDAIQRVNDYWNSMVSGSYYTIREHYELVNNTPSEDPDWDHITHHVLTLSNSLLFEGIRYHFLKSSI